MYIPAAFNQADPDTLLDFIEAYNFGLLISEVDDEPFVTHLPFLLDRAGGSLISHLAAANPHWRRADGHNVLAVFSGPHAYISPTWYEADHVVPTWNYVAVHVHGTLRVVRDEDALLQIVRDLVVRHEAPLPRPWQLDEPFARKLLQQIVGFRIAITRIEGKWKLNQNRPAEQRAKVIRALQGQADDHSQAIARLMAETLPTKGTPGV